MALLGLCSETECTFNFLLLVTRYAGPKNPSSSSGRDDLAPCACLHYHVLLVAFGHEFSEATLASGAWKMNTCIMFPPSDALIFDKQEMND